MTERDSVQPWMKAAAAEICSSRRVRRNETILVKTVYFSEAEIAQIIAEHAKEQSAPDYGSIPDETQKYTPEQWAAWRFGFKCGQDWQQATWTKGEAEASQSTPYKEKK